MRFISYWAVSLAMIAAAVSAGSALGAPASTQAARPTIAFLSPNIAEKGMTFFISGNNLKGATSVKLGSLTMKFTVVSPKAITATVPKNGKTAKVTVTTKSGTVTSKAALQIIPHRFA
jgi:hypothetical protein